MYSSCLGGANNTHEPQEIKLENKKSAIDLESGRRHTSHNTASHKHRTQSTDSSVKKKCCTIL